MGVGSKGYPVSDEKPVVSSLQMTAVPTGCVLGLVQEAH